MVKANTGTQQNHTEVFRTSKTTIIGRSTYLVERHFTGQRDYQQAVFTAVENEAKRTETLQNQHESRKISA